MKDPDFPLNFYRDRLSDLQVHLKRLHRVKTLVGWLRLAIVVITALIVFFCWNGNLVIAFSIIVPGLALFFFIVSKDTDNRREIENLEVLEQINTKELRFSQGDFIENEDGGKFEPEHHVYAHDLDLFGNSSLYQYVNRCNAEQAKKLLAKRFLEPMTKLEIEDRQQAVKDLSGQPLWRQQLQAYGIRQPINLVTEEKVRAWLETTVVYFEQPAFKILLFIFPLLTLGATYLCISGLLSTGAYLFLLTVFISIATLLSAKVTPLYNLLSKTVSEIDVLYNELDWFEKGSFSSDLLKRLQGKLSGEPGKASSEIMALRKILTRFDARLSWLAFFILNTFFLWDLWQVLALKNWKARNRNFVSNWFQVIAEIETINSFATLSFNHPAWCFPLIVPVHFTFSAEELGHPLIPFNQCVTNSFEESGIAKVDLITGSNMAGKSTFLRSVGINMVLAYAGAPVCAKKFSVSLAWIVSSMRIEDNLAENASTFYAELKKLKLIIDMVNEEKKVFILLDEILRGTNSLDRHTGSAALVKQLVKKKAVALIATHDLELAKMEQEFPANIRNYYFDVQVSGDELYFDYRLKKGICSSMNAYLLMKKIGIELS